MAYEQLYAMFLLSDLLYTTFAYIYMCFLHTRKFYENCKKSQKKEDSIFNAMEKI